MNDTIKRKIKESRIMQYEIAAKIGIRDDTVSRWFRNELTAEHPARTLAATAHIQKREAHV